MQIATTSTGHITRVFDDFLKMSKITKFSVLEHLMVFAENSGGISGLTPELES